MTCGYGTRKLAKTYLLFCLGTVVTTLPNRVDGQGHFEGPKTTIQYQQYKAVWECLSAVDRVRDSIRIGDPVWRDTLPLVEGEERTSLPDVVVQLAQQCGKRFPDSSEQSIYPWIELMLIRNDTITAEKLVRQEVTQKQYEGQKEAVAAMNEVLLVYSRVRERHLLAMEVIADFIKRQSLSPEYQTVVWGKYLGVAQARNDQKLAEAVGGIITVLVGQLGNGEGDGSDMRWAIAQGIQARYKRELLDTLRVHGSAAYRRFLLKIHEEGERNGWLEMWQHEGGLRGVGEQAAPIQALTWYPDIPSGGIPAAGRVSLIIFLDNRSHSNKEGNSESFDFYMTLRRIKQRFPDLDVTIVSRTLGWFWHGPPVSVREEGAVIRKWLLETRQLPARLAIDSTPWYRIPGLDRRRVNLASDNDRNYWLGSATDVGPGDPLAHGEHAVLVTGDGMILKTGLLRRWTERDYAEMIDVLMQQQTAQQ